ncbi:PRC-barrel domain-containing protein [Halostagnicola kamekurae]|uniref:Sporulation protein YlmC, PRC-barrel domain family n=1 Tax=Halostagnicola kamekurae TaxID=619731 RepID=A0A1I6TP73_9EURY|nr:PRC-barrel domain-containing protein [Halostagnicola kamekurae]SFS90954.1 Sporulation protein YlmC, PRC-barrel domain family [Halostagnicola kamekurae]
MGEILARNLIDKSIVGTDGTDFGTLANVTMGLESAALRNLIVDPNENLSLQSVDFERNEEGRLLIPIDRISTLNDQIVVHR